VEQADLSGPAWAELSAEVQARLEAVSAELGRESVGAS